MLSRYRLTLHKRREKYVFAVSIKSFFFCGIHCLQWLFSLSSLAFYKFGLWGKKRERLCGLSGVCLRASISMQDRILRSKIKIAIIIHMLSTASMGLVGVICMYAHHVCCITRRLLRKGRHKLAANLSKTSWSIQSMISNLSGILGHQSWRSDYLKGEISHLALTMQKIFQVNMIKIIIITANAKIRLY